MEGATNLDDLLGNAPVQQQHSQATTFAPIVTGGVDPFVTAGISTRQPTISQAHTFSTIRYAVKNFVVYFGFFLAAMVISLSTPRSLILQYIPNTYTSGGVPSYMGAGILAASAVLIGYVIGTLLNTLI